MNLIRNAIQGKIQSSLWVYIHAPKGQTHTQQHKAKIHLALIKGESTHTQGQTFSKGHCSHYLLAKPAVCPCDQHKGSTMYMGVTADTL